MIENIEGEQHPAHKEFISKLHLFCCENGMKMGMTPRQMVIALGEYFLTSCQSETVRGKK